MSLKLKPPATYLITSGKTTPISTTQSEEFQSIIRLVRSAVAASISFIQLREKSLSARVLYELTTQCADVTRGSATRLLVNDRADVAVAAGADGVQLTGHSLPVEVIRRDFGAEFLIGVSTHSPAEAARAAAEGADFAVFGPVFDTPSKRQYGAPVGLCALREAVTSKRDFPVIAIGGITLENVRDCFANGAKGIAAIRLFEEASDLESLVDLINREYLTSVGN
jgi:thiamine-phosphate pyrophosphorylase